MTRDATDPRVVEIMAAVDLAIASPHDGMADSAISHIVLRLYSDGQFPGWPSESMRALALAYALIAPEHVVDAMLEEARRQMELIPALNRELAEDGPRKAGS